MKHTQTSTQIPKRTTCSPTVGQTWGWVGLGLFHLKKKKQRSQIIFGVNNASETIHQFVAALQVNHAGALPSPSEFWSRADRPCSCSHGEGADTTAAATLCTLRGRTPQKEQGCLPPPQATPR
uniref:Uncharacterized protein n=1 Tax=Eutreptiella gymnastica TaxID=73025 RepID=A0A7S4GE53_9EUGL